MGLLKAGIGALSGVLSDSWRDYFYCESLSSDILMIKASRRTGKKSSNKGDGNIISDGSIVAINEGQCMMIVEQGLVVDFCAEPGEFVYDTSTEPSIFYGDFGESLKQTFQTLGKRFQFGGDTGKDQRVYYFNTKEIMGNKYGTPSPVPFRVVDQNIGLDVDISIRCNGEYSYKIVDPMLFYKNVSGNVEREFTRGTIDSQLKTELMTALQPALAKISGMGIRYSALPGHTMEVADALNQVLSEKWSGTRGLAVASFGINSVTASEEDEEMIKNLQRTATYRDPGMAAATMVDAQAEAMKSAAKNTGGAVIGFAGMDMAKGAGGIDAQTLFQMNAEKKAAQEGDKDKWSCSCGTKNSGNFCVNCGKAKPAPENEWTCSCGRKCTGNFCVNCGKAKPAPEGEWTCSCGKKCTGNFCVNCGSKKPEL